MDAESWQRVQTLFLAALEEEPESWSAFLDSACGDDESVRAEVWALLGAHQDSQALEIESSLAGSDAPDDDADSFLGTAVGPYRLVRHLGRGGMGDVYLAERDDAHFQQRVAVKLIRPGFATSSLAARFRTERQILARLVHPHIASLLDGGMTEDGRPYLVMQYIEGIPLTEHCNQHQLPIAERLVLFRQVCGAVQFAHRNLIVHRDLKPSNILVTADGETRLLDFGIAKLLDPGALDLSVAATRSELRLLTPEHAAPEQFRGEAITTATDVYALGVLLYELLTDRRPHRLATVGSASEIERIVCQEVPKRPSTAVAEVGSEAVRESPEASWTSQGTAASRRLPVPRLRKLLRGDLDNIVMTALRKEPARRYASVEALSEDVARYLTGRPVSARADTVGYRVSKFVARNRLGVGAALLVALLVVGFGVAMAVQAARIGEHARALEEERDRVRRQAEKAVRVQTLVSDLFKVLDPDEKGGSPNERLQAAAQRVVEDLEEEGELQAELMDEVITIYINLGLYEEALAMAEASLEVRRKAYGPRDPEVAWGIHRLGEALFLSSRFGPAETRYREALALQREVLGSNHNDVARGLIRLSRLQRALGRHREAEANAEEAHAIYRDQFGDHHPRTAEALFHVAVPRSRLAGQAAGESLYRQVLAVQKDLLGEDHPEVGWTLAALGNSVLQQERLDEAEPILQEALVIQEARYGAEHPDVSRTRMMIGRVHEMRGDLPRAEEHYRRVLKSRSRRLGEDHVATASGKIHIARVLLRQGQFSEAEDLLLQAAPVRQKRFGADHGLAQDDLRLLAELYEKWGRPKELAEVRARLQEPVESRSPKADRLVSAGS